MPHAIQPKPTGVPSAATDPAIVGLTPTQVADNLLNAAQKDGRVGASLQQDLQGWLAAMPATSRASAIQAVATAMGTRGAPDEQQDIGGDALMRAGHALGLDAPGSHAGAAGLDPGTAATNLLSAASQGGIPDRLQNDLFGYLADRSGPARQQTMAAVADHINSSGASDTVKQAALSALQEAYNEAQAAHPTPSPTRHAAAGAASSSSSFASHFGPNAGKTDGSIPSA